MPSKPRRKEPEVIGLIGVGLDGSDGHTRITRSEEFVVLGGSESTHERMQETAIKLTEALEKRGRTIRNASVTEIVDILHETNG
jgi:hypothetical protein